jgi:Domain of unknown function (DUF4129)
MKLGWPVSGSRHGAAYAFAAFILLAVSLSEPIAARSQEIQSDAGWRDLSVEQYQQQLQNLDSIVAACQKQRSGAAPAQTTFPACDPAQIGPDDRVQWPPGSASPGSASPGPASPSREVRYDWLRSVLERAAKKSDASGKSIFAAIPGTGNKPASVDELLSAAHHRLQDDATQAGSPLAPNPDYSSERASMNSILAQRAYQRVTSQSALARFREWLGNLLDKIFSGLIRFGAHAPWIAWLFRILLLVAICTALVWFLLRIERRSRIRLVPDVEPAPGAPSAREWQLWLRDAQAMAAKGLWREAIHFVYWASIARLESKRLWPADRARTPREYLALLAATDPRKPNLGELTRSFERTWYGGRTAQASDFNAALEQAAALGVAAE